MSCTGTASSSHVTYSCLCAWVWYQPMAGAWDVMRIRSLEEVGAPLRPHMERKQHPGLENATSVPVNRISESALSPRAEVTS